LKENLPMKENKIVYRCCQLAGILLIVAALAKAISINNLVIGATTGDISKHYATSVLIDWSFSCMLLSLIAIWLLFLAHDLKNLQKRAWSQTVLIGLAFSLFGAGFWFRYPSSIHLPFFLVVGLLLLIPLLIYSRQFKQ
jgi:hypothetical protein